MVIEYDLVYRCDANPHTGMGHLSRALLLCNIMFSSDPSKKVAICGNYSEMAMAYIFSFGNRGIDILDRDFFINSGNSAKVILIDNMYYPEHPSFVPKEETIEMRKIAKKLIFYNGVLDAPDLIELFDLFINYLPVNLEIPVNYLTGFNYLPLDIHKINIESSHSTDIKGILAIIGSDVVNEGPARLLECSRIDNTKNKISGLVLSPQFPKKKIEMLEKDFPEVLFFQNVPSLLALMARYQSVITTYGNSTFEALLLKKNVYTINYKSFQNDYSEFMASKGYLTNLGRFELLSNQTFFDKISKGEKFKKTEIGVVEGITSVISIIKKYQNEN
jgi:spore coat polysaccharide biosynthesis predicted glycosyltransferase SpsG